MLVKYVPLQRPENGGPGDDPSELLREGQIYTVESRQVKGWFTQIRLEEFPGKTFDDLSFSYVQEPVPDDWNAISNENFLKGITNFSFEIKNLLKAILGNIYEIDSRVNEHLAEYYAADIQAIDQNKIPIALSIEHLKGSKDAAEISYNYILHLSSTLDRSLISASKAKNEPKTSDNESDSEAI